jgi:hypothetical protein
MRVLQVGELYRPGRTSYSPGYQYNWNERSHVLLLIVDRRNKANALRGTETG